MHLAAPELRDQLVETFGQRRLRVAEGRLAEEAQADLRITRLEAPDAVRVVELAQGTGAGLRGGVGAQRLPVVEAGDGEVQPHRAEAARAGLVHERAQLAGEGRRHRGAVGLEITLEHLEPLALAGDLEQRRQDQRPVHVAAQHRVQLLGGCYELFLERQHHRGQAAVGPPGR